MSRDLVERARQGDHAAFAALVRPRFDRLSGVAARILRDPYAAEDAVQDAIVRAWRDLRALRDPDLFEPWLFRALVNVCRTELQRRGRRPGSLTLLDGDVGPRTEDAATDIARRDEIDRAFERLSIEHRAVLVLTYYVGYSAPEIAATLDVPVGTIYSRLHSAAARMRGQLEPRITHATTSEHAR